MIHKAYLPLYFPLMMNLLEFCFLTILNILKNRIFNFLRFVYYLKSALWRYKLLFLIFTVNYLLDNIFKTFYALN